MEAKLVNNNGFLSLGEVVKTAPKVKLSIVQACEALGKTHLSLTYPKRPIYFMDLDNNALPVFSRLQEKDDIFVRQYHINNMPGSSWTVKEPVFKQFEKDFYSLVKSDSPGTIIIDSVSVLYPLAKDVIMNRKAQQYRSKEVQRFDIALVDEWIKSLTDTVKLYNKDIIFIAREKKLWEGSGANVKWKGNYEAKDLPLELVYSVYYRYRIYLDKLKQKRILVMRNKINPILEGISIPYPYKYGWLDLDELNELNENWEMFDNSSREIQNKLEELVCL